VASLPAAIPRVVLESHALAETPPAPLRDAAVSLAVLIR
jgi:hypothetical protein